MYVERNGKRYVSAPRCQRCDCYLGDLGMPLPCLLGVGFQWVVFRSGFDALGGWVGAVILVTARFWWLVLFGGALSCSGLSYVGLLDEVVVLTGSSLDG